MKSNPSNQTFPRPILLWLAAASLVLALTGCKRGNAQSAMPPPPQVTVAPVEQQELVEWEELTGRSAAVEFVEVRPRVSGHIDKVLFESGQLLKKGDVLFAIDPRWYKAEYERREAELAMAKVRMDNAEREAKRNAQLLASKAISKEEADGREARFAEARAALLVAEAGRDTAKLDLEYTQIRSPIDGRVSRAVVTAGNYISGIAGAATLLTTIVSVDPIYVYADMDENALLRYNALTQSGKQATNGEGKVPVELQLADEEGFAHHGYVESLDNRLDAQSGSIVLRTLFPNPSGRIVPGLFARIRLPASAKAPVLLVDESAIGTDQAQKFVLALTSTNTAAYRPVKLGAQVNGKRVVREGLQAGEKIVVNGLARVRPGMPVSPQEAVATNGNPKVAKN
jgi:RND family efflux transporter MFP subunit